MVPLFLDEIMTKPINHVARVFVPNVRCKSMFGGSHWDLQFLDPFSQYKSTSIKFGNNQFDNWIDGSHANEN